jgi:YhcH/YjgK/YiaL family protein
MVLDDLNCFEKYQHLHPAFPAALGFLKSIDFASFTSGKRVILGDQIYATASCGMGKGLEHARLEVHKVYIDIQITVNGIDNIGWKPLHKCSQPDGEYNPEKDVQLFSDVPDTWFGLTPGSFALFFPEDAHAPLAIQGTLHKIVVKVRV